MKDRVWRSLLIARPPARVGAAGDATTAEDALRRMRAGELLVYEGDYHNARQLLAAAGRRLARRAGRERGGGVREAFLAERRLKAVEHDVLSRLAVPLAGDHAVMLRRAPDVRRACAEALGEPDGREGLIPLRELLGMIGAHEWRVRGVPVPALSGSVHPHYGVFAPVRGEYVELVAAALSRERLAPQGAPHGGGSAASIGLEGLTAFDVGTGTGVLALLAARAGARVVATELEPRAVACARENVARFELAGAIEVRQGDLFPEGRADLVLCNPPWLPGEAHVPLERAVYDPGGRFLERFIGELRPHLTPGGKALLVLSDLAEIVGLRERGWVEGASVRAGLAASVAGETTPSHPRARDEDDPLHAARAREVTRLYCLSARS